MTVARYDLCSPCSAMAVALMHHEGFSQLPCTLRGTAILGYRSSWCRCLVSRRKYFIVIQLTIHTTFPLPGLVVQPFSPPPMSNTTSINWRWHIHVIPTIEYPFITSTILAMSIYMIIVQTLRYKRVQSLEHQVSDFTKLTPAQAQKIISVPLAYDLPFITFKAAQFALFQAYGIVRSVCLDKNSLSLIMVNLNFSPLSPG